jgi:iron-sulfur cluster repair protein YtfE (RIC family)
VTTHQDIDATAIVNDVLRRYPTTVRVFNTFGIDACCGSGVSLAAAAARDGADLGALLDALRCAIREAA